LKSIPYCASNAVVIAPRIHSESFRLLAAAFAVIRFISSALKRTGTMRPFASPFGSFGRPIFFAFGLFGGRVSVLPAFEVVHFGVRQSRAALFVHQGAEPIAMPSHNVIDWADLNLIASERPWFLITMDGVQDSHGIFIVSAINRGNTPGELSGGRCSFKKRPFDFKGPTDDTDVLFLLPMQNLIVTGDSFLTAKLTQLPRLTDLKNGG